MPLGLLGKKLGMTRIFDEEAGSSIPVTVIDVAGNAFLQTKTADNDGYSAVQIGYGDQKEQPVTEDMEPKPAVPYAVSKLAAER